MSDIPSTHRRLPEGMPRTREVPKAAIDVRVLHAHLVKHVLGARMFTVVGASARRRRWNAEDWPRHLGRPAEEVFARRVAIAALDVDGHRCGYGQRLAREDYGGEHLDTEFCYVCAPQLLEACRARCDDLLASYLRTTDEVLSRAEDLRLVGRREALRQVYARALRAEPRSLDPSDLVLSYDLAPPSPADDAHALPRVRLSTAQGVRVELEFRGGCWRWRTTYADRVDSTTDRFTFLLEWIGRPSDPVAVPRHWIEPASTSAPAPVHAA
jgi:hypothetical protein